jgi:hypothetical protein
MQSFDSSDPQAVERQADLARLAEERRRNVVITIMQTREGRAWFYTMLSKCGVYTAPFVPGDSHHSAFLAGMQAVGHVLMEEIMGAAPEFYWVMVSESKDYEDAGVSKSTGTE